MAGGVSNVEVQPTHTRRSIMTQMLCHQINGIHGRGEPLTALFATESVIYGRFGYGHDQVIVWAFEKGADDYIVKLFLPTELAAGVQAALRRRAGAGPGMMASSEPYVRDELSIDCAQRLANVAGNLVRLTTIE